MTTPSQTQPTEPVEPGDKETIPCAVMRCREWVSMRVFLPVQIDGKAESMLLACFAKIVNGQLLDFTVDPSEWNRQQETRHQGCPESTAAAPKENPFLPPEFAQRLKEHLDRNERSGSHERDPRKSARPDLLPGSEDKPHMPPRAEESQ